MNRVDIAKVLLRYGANADAQSKVCIASVRPSVRLSVTFCLFHCLSVCLSVCLLLFCSTSLSQLVTTYDSRRLQESLTTSNMT